MAGYGNEGGVQARKQMGMGKLDSGASGVAGYPGRGRRESPDHAMGTGTKGAMSDAERAIGAPVRHSADHHPAQAAPNHGPGHESKLGFDRNDRGI